MVIDGRGGRHRGNGRGHGGGGVGASSLSSSSPPPPLMAITPPDVRCSLGSPLSAGALVAVGPLEYMKRFTAAYRDLRYSWSLAAPRAIGGGAYGGCRHWAGRVLLATHLHWPGLWWTDQW